MKSKTGLAALIVFTCCILFAGAVAAQVAGFKISTPVVSNQTPFGADADFDVIAYGNTSSPLPALRAGTPLANSSSNIFTNSYSFGNGLRPYQVRLAVNSAWNTSAPPALSFGDGSTQQTMALALETTGTFADSKPALEASSLGLGNTFRGSFSHTYPNGNFTLKARLTPVGSYGSPTPGVGAYQTLTQGQAYVGTLINTFTYQVTVSALSPPGTGTYSYQTTNVTTNTFTNTVVEAKASEMVAINASPPTLTVDGGLCPGSLNVTISNGTPGARVTFWAANNPGATAIGMGPCAKTIVDLDTAEPRRSAFFDGMGEYSFSRFFTPTQCNIMMQAVNHGNCAKSSVELPPMSPPPPTVGKPSVAGASGVRGTGAKGN